MKKKSFLNLNQLTKQTYKYIPKHLFMVIVCMNKVV